MSADEGSLKTPAKTGGNCPKVPKKLIVAGAEREKALAALQQAVDQAIAVPETRAIDDKKIEAFDMDIPKDLIANNFIIIRKVDFNARKVVRWVQPWAYSRAKATGPSIRTLE